MIDTTGRHPGVQSICRSFVFQHLQPGKPRDMSEAVAALVEYLLVKLPGDDPELTAGLRHLLEAKDCFVRAAVYEKGKS